MPSEVPQLKLLLKEEHHFPARVSVIYRLQVLENIRKHLSPEDLEAFKSSCFGHLLGLENLGKQSGQLMHYLLLRQVECEKNHEVWFSIEGKPARFSLDEFAIVTGLNCGPFLSSNEVYALKMKYRLRDDYFKDDEGRVKVRITLEELENKFIEMSDIEGEKKKKMVKTKMKMSNPKEEKKKKKKKKIHLKEKSDHLRLALIYCLEGVLLSQERKNTIRMENLGLVEDLDVFNNYAWGLESYKKTIASLKKDMVERFTNLQKKGHTKDQYTVYGFPYALQVWAYEAIPLIGKTFAKRLEGDVTPRLLRWDAKDPPEYKDILKTFKKQKNVSKYLRFLYPFTICFLVLIYQFCIFVIVLCQQHLTTI